jgi:hypothetical protein
LYLPIVSKLPSNSSTSASRRGKRTHRGGQAGNKDEWKVVSKSLQSLQALQRKVDEFVEDVQVELEQTEIGDFAG